MSQDLTTADALIAATDQFWNACYGHYNTTGSANRCRFVQRGIWETGQGFILYRAGLLCAALGQCLRPGCHDDTGGVTAPGYGGQPDSTVSGPLSLCTVEGVRGGTPAPGNVSMLPAALFPTAYLVDSALPSSGCSDGNTCQSTGQYVMDDCGADGPQQAAGESFEHALGMDWCMDDGLDGSVGCPDGFYCAKHNSTRGWYCNATEQVYYPSGSQGWSCLPLAPTFAANAEVQGLELRARLGAAPAPLEDAPWGALFDDPSAALLGAPDCACGTDDWDLVCRLGARTTDWLRVYDRPTLKARSPLLLLLDPSRAFGGSVAVVWAHELCNLCLDRLEPVAIYALTNTGTAARTAALAKALALINLNVTADCPSRLLGVVSDPATSDIATRAGAMCASLWMCRVPVNLNRITLRHGNSTSKSGGSLTFCSIEGVVGGALYYMPPSAWSLHPNKFLAPNSCAVNAPPSLPLVAPTPARSERPPWTPCAGATRAAAQLGAVRRPGLLRHRFEFSAPAAVA
ncbi:hypothetical protein HYH03_017420 [Edaphochlamys debaryana]|uniref:Uncharacterized protein n=1 Tax=Edaphochlamys debaryana TaxID=47281 RepID=A0A836BQE9_9CHLO|nr:hypothetical protein HYH03_017420 [Edaphochlamys debaryana]|eukprot:KAG2483699.1 hypothetical protein HYH03_017420 [Edaphochlamys debaryana]